MSDHRSNLMAYLGIFLALSVGALYVYYLYVGSQRQPLTPLPELSLGMELDDG